jgi:hypothetical protein
VTDVKTKRGVVLGSVLIRGHSIVNIDAITGNAPVRQRFIFSRHSYLIDPAVRRNIIFFDEIECPNNDYMPERATEIALLV